MDDKILETVKKLMSVQLPDKKPPDMIAADDSLKDLGINSLTFIKTVVSLEDEFGFEFKDEDLEVGKFQNVGDIADYIENIQKFNMKSRETEHR